ncbi:hypothetical protein RHMOL_Rhmol04G0290000 [Rhododendron molle]|uniref:Uncharacterized protein n=1 Tax=Rhododendron molle TaxID=49168 RepID=A0ACC0P840_RHOML|nr:hypothetical protein RHMOL_Rhmol04G0290000 [Rhododendron molle]
MPLKEKNAWKLECHMLDMWSFKASFRLCSQKSADSKTFLHKTFKAFVDIMKENLAHETAFVVATQFGISGENLDDISNRLRKLDRLIERSRQRATEFLAWSWTVLKKLLLRLQSVILDQSKRDELRWRWASDNCFSVKSVYNKWEQSGFTNNWVMG